jgi:hypothetical protein
MTNQARGIISAVIDGNPLELRIATNEWCDLEDEHGKTTDELANGFQNMAAAEKLDMRMLRSFFRAAASYSKPGITHDEAGELMTKHGLVESALLIGRVIITSMPEVKTQVGKPAAVRKHRR